MADMTKSLLDAGALVPIKTKIKDPEHVDEISARRYHHPAIGDQPVVRLTADKLAQGDDLEMEFLGFGVPEVTGPLAYRRRQALGFPGWALIYDPDHARYALELVKEFKKAARKAKSKPGHGYDAYVDIAKRLGKSVAHFLPSFWEQVGREFIQIGNNMYASRAFGKAREAEKVHALNVDEKLRQDAFLEFALAGCLSNKALVEYGKELQETLEGKEAWQFFRELCVRRTLGGMPPWTSLPKDFKPLITAAKLDVNEEMKSFLAEILESPAMSRASMGFWKACSSYFKELAIENDHVAGILLNLMPETSRWDRSDVWKWLEMLEDWNVLSHAWEKDASNPAGPQGGIAAWFSKYATIDDQPPQRIYDILIAAAAQIKKEKKPIKLTVEGWGNASINVDLLDLALELKVPVADPPDNTEMSLTDWATPNDDAKDRPRDPVHIHAHKRYGKLLEAAVPNAAGQAEFEAVAKGKKALAAARKNWLLGLVDQLANSGVPGAAAALSELESKTSRATYREFPEAYEKLKTIDLAPVLGRTLAGGVIDEYGWPIAEEVADRLSQNGKQEITVFGRFPYLMITDGLHVVVVDHEKIVLEHELKMPKKSKLDDLLFYDGQLCVYYDTPSYQSKFYWSSNPKKTTECYHYSGEKVGGAFIDLPDGGSFEGQRTVHAGDTERITSPNKFVFDGEHFWKMSWQEHSRAFQEVNPQTGKEGRWSMPSFFEDYLTDGGELLTNHCELLHLGEPVKNSPLGSQDGTVGWRVRKSKNGTVECEGIDGRIWKAKDTLKNQVPSGLMNQPGTSERLPITGDYGWNWGWNDVVSMWDPSGTYEIAQCQEELGDYNRGQVTSMPPLFWHALSVRDEKTSKKLRSINAAQAKKLLAAVVEDLRLSDEIEDPLSDRPKTETTLKNWLKDLTHPRLQRGLLSVISHAGEQVQRLANLLEGCDPEGEDAFSFDPAMEAVVQPAMQVFGIYYYGEDEPLFPHLGEVVGYITGKQKTPRITKKPFEWWELLKDLDTRIWSAYFEAQEKEEAWLTFLEHYAHLGIPDLPGKFRHLEGEFDGSAPVNTKVRNDEEDWIGYHYQGNVYFLYQEWGDDWKILEYAPEGKFHLLPKFKIDTEQTYEPSWNGETIREFVRLARENEKPFLSPETLADFANRLVITPAEVGLVWFGFPHFDNYDKNFLPKPLREQLKLKVAEAEAARQALKALPDEMRAKLVRVLLDGPLDELWTDEGQKPLERLAAAWDKIVPKRLTLPPKLLDQLTDAFPYSVDRGAMVVALASPQSHPMFTADAEWTYYKDGYWTHLWSDQKGETFDDSVLAASAIAIPFLSYHLPVGDAVRNDVPAIHQAALKCLQSPKLLVDFVQRHDYDSDDDDTGKKMLEKALGKKSQKHNAGWMIDEGLFVGYAEGYQAQFAVRPAKLKTEKDSERLKQMYGLLYDGEDAFENWALESLQQIRSEGYQRICERIKKTPVPDGQFESNPALSVPELVAEVEKKLKLSPEAATMYLQILTLPDCTTANVKLWNGWTTGAFNKAAKELAKQELVLEAKRSRAGRSCFLLGGWEALKLPHLPIETWKLPLYEITRNPTGQLNTPLPRILPLVPVHELFETAWNRTQTGDAPGYEEVS